MTVNNAPPAASIVMVSYNTGPVLFQAVQAALAQTVLVELLLVNNGNPPEDEARLRQMAAADNRLCLIEGHSNIGFAAGCNKGARAAVSEYILFLNPDGILPPDAVEKLIAKSAGLARPYMLGVQLLDAEGRSQRGSRRALLTPTTAVVEALHLYSFFPGARLNFHKQPLPAGISRIPAISGAFMFMPREDFWKIGGFDEDYFLHVDDLDLCLRFRRAGGEIYFIPDITVTHIGGTSGVTLAFVEKHKARGFVRYFHKNFAREHSGFSLWLMSMAAWGWAYTRIFFGAFGRRRVLRRMPEPGAGAPQPYVSIVIPTYNRAKAVHATVLSVLAQTYRNFELIVVNDASTDTTEEDLKQITDPRLIIITNKKNQGSGGARNTGIKSARGKWIAFLDHDDQWMPNKLVRQLYYMENIATDCPASVTDYLLLTTRQNWVKRRSSKVSNHDWLMLTGTGLSMGSTMMARRDVFETIGVFDPQDPDTGNRTEDWDWFLRYRRQFKLAVVPEILTFYHGPHRAKFDVERSAIRYIWNKHHASIQAEGEGPYRTFSAAVSWKLARVDLNQRRYWDCFKKVAGVTLIRPFDAVRYASVVLGDVLPRLRGKNRQAA